VRTIPLTKGKVAIVDDADYERINQWKWCASWRRKRNVFYAVRHEKVNGRQITILMHREVMGLGPGRKIQVDHIDPPSTLDNRRSNLRLATNSQNMLNRGRQGNNKSGYKGVFFCPRYGKWQATIYLNRKIHYLGRFYSAEAAHLAYEAKSKELHGEFSRAS